MVHAFLSGFGGPSVALAQVFGEARSYPVGTSPIAIAAGRFHGGAGGADLVTAEEGNSLSFLRNIGGGVFESGGRVNFDERYIATAMVSGTFNGDGIGDVAVAADDALSFPDFTGVVLIFLSNGPLQYQQVVQPVGEFPTCVAQGDVSGDGRADLLVCASRSGNGLISLLPGLPGGSFGPAMDVSVGSVVPNKLIVADLNRDGNSEVIILDAEANTVRLYPGTAGGPAFGAPVTVGSVVDPRAIAAVDLNGDDQLDLVIVSRSSARVISFVQTSSLTFAPGLPAATGLFPGSIAVGRFDEDELEDVVVANYGSNDVTLLLSNGDGTLRFQESISVGAGPVAVVAADFNDDGKWDFATANQDDQTFGRNTQSVSVVLNGVTPEFTPTPTTSALATATSSTPPPTVGSQTPASSVTPTPLRTPAGPEDMNCDGIIDSQDIAVVTRKLFDPSAGCMDRPVTAADITRVIRLIAASEATAR